jgi:hypothetical protein
MLWRQQLKAKVEREGTAVTKKGKSESEKPGSERSGGSAGHGHPASSSMAARKDTQRKRDDKNDDGAGDGHDLNPKLSTPNPKP